jgi:hypothetical protein
VEVCGVVKAFDVLEERLLEAKNSIVEADFEVFEDFLEASSKVCYRLVDLFR